MNPPDPYAEAVKFQTAHLANWKSKLRPEIFKAVHDHVLASNDADSGRCYRGQDIVQIILEWSHLSSVYAIPAQSDVI